MNLNFSLNGGVENLLVELGNIINITSVVANMKGRENPDLQNALGCLTTIRDNIIIRRDIEASPESENKPTFSCR